MRSQPSYKKDDKIGGRYHVHHALMGGMGEVYLCLDLETIQPYALKTVQQHYRSPKLREFFENEVAVWIALEKHPNIVRCFYLDVIDNQPFIFLEWIASDENRGADLRNWLRKGPLDLRLALDFTIDICRGLIHAQHKQPGLVHRDLKPENILITRSRVAKITDFGLAQIVQETDWWQSTRQDGIAGTPPYMAPEQWRGETLDARTDVYAIGCILHELLTGRLLFQARTRDDLRRHHLEADIPKLAKGKKWSDSIDALLAHCLAKQKEERYGVRELLQELTLIYHEQFDRSPRASDEFTAMDFFNRGYTYEKLQRYEKALDDYSQAIELDPTLTEANSGLVRIYHNRGLTFINLQQYNNALDNFDRAIQLDPTNAIFYIDRGNTYRNSQRYYEALADYSRAIQLYKSDIACYNRGFTYDETDDLPIQPDPKWVEVYANRGLIYDKLQRYHEALADYDRAILLDPTDAATYFKRGLTYDKLQQHNEALADYHQAIKLDPNFVNAYVNIGVLRANLGTLQEALSYFEQAAQLGDAQARRYATQVRQMLSLKVFQQAASIFEMRCGVAKYPFMTNTNFITAVEQVIELQITPEHRPAFEQRLAWLRQIAEEQKRKE